MPHNRRAMPRHKSTHRLTLVRPMQRRQATHKQNNRQMRLPQLLATLLKIRQRARMQVRLNKLHPQWNSPQT
jgi:hypothetical protein